MKKPKTLKISYKKDEKTGLYTHDFDLTHFDTRHKFEEFLKKHNLTDYKRIDISTETDESPRYQYTWSNPQRTLIITASNNPISGKYTIPDMRDKERGYASSMSVNATTKEKTAYIVLDILNNADMVKDHGHGFTGLKLKTAEKIKGVTTNE